LIDIAGVTRVFIGVAVLVLMGWVLSFGLVEPRKG
jgi:hypothetical protein